MSITQNQLSIGLDGQIQSGTMVSLNFQSLPGANPSTLGYFVAIWQGTQIQALSNAIPPIQKITTSSQDGSATFTGLSLANLDYTIGFGVNDQLSTSVCATLAVPKGAPQFQDLTSELSSVTVQNISSDSLIASFITPAYNLAATNKNWIALFKGAFTANMYQGTNVIGTPAFAADNTNTGAIAMNNIPGGLPRFQKYTIVYGMGLDEAGNPDYSNLVSATEFDVP
jgi:hypothetical protein